MIDDKLLLGLAIGAVPSLFTLIRDLINSRTTRENAFVTALQKELNDQREENRRVRQALAESEAREKEWRTLWQDTFNTGRAALLRAASSGDPAS